MVHEGEMRLSEAELSDRISSGTSLAVLMVRECPSAQFEPAQEEMEPGVQRPLLCWCLALICIGSRGRNGISDNESYAGCVGYR
jgi:hypothetical protein